MIDYAKKQQVSGLWNVKNGEKMKTWLKGGLIGAGIGILIIIISLLTGVADFLYLIGEPSVYLLSLLKISTTGPLAPLFGIVVNPLIIGFILGSIIGLIVGKNKSRRKNE